MPELPEVETVKRGLSRLIIGKKIISYSFDWPKSFPNNENIVREFLVGASVKEVRRRGKALMIDLDTNYSLVVHLKMTGQLVYVGDQRFAAGHPNDSMVNDLPDTSTRVILTFADASKLFFNDQRKFGWMILLPTLEVPSMSFMQKLGPEPLVDSFTKKHFVERIKRKKNSPIKAAILDQSILAGVGNIYADEALFGSNIHPARRVSSLSSTQLGLLLENIKHVMNLSIEHGGSTDKNYRDAEGRKGSYLTFANVFRREGEPCLVDGTPILKTRVAGRGTHYCPTCQKPPRGFK